MSTAGFRLLSCVMLLALACPAAVADEDSDFAAIEMRILGEIRATSGRKLSYPGSEHLYAARTLAAKGETEPALARLDAWLDLDYKHSNWWVNHIPIPRAVGEVALLLRDDLGAERKTRVMRVLRRAWPPPKGGIGVGANLFYRLDAAVLIALIERDAGMLRRVFERAAREIRVTKKEGLQADMSFHQHGPQFYSGSYGLEYVRGAVRLVELGHGTGLALSDERTNLLVGFLLDGLQWITLGSMIDPGAQGRSFSRKSAGRGARTLLEYCNRLAALDPPRGDEFDWYAERLIGNRCFWRSDFMVHRRLHWYASVKMASVRTVGTESGNGEGLQQFHMADGACLVMQRGDEYDGIQPVWNWRRVPGTTTKQGKGKLPLVNWGRGARGTKAFVGGVSDGRCGVACMDFDRGGVRAKKAWFFFDHCVLCLGAGITAEGPEEVVTTINQCLARGLISARDSAFWHDGVCYVSLEGGHRAHTALQRGTWKAVNRGYGAEPVERMVFSAWIDHGVAPRDARYAYVIQPGRKRPWKFSDGRVLANTPKIQAVMGSGAHQRVGVVFHEPGELKYDWLDGEARVATDRPCVLLWKPGGSSRAEFWVADPAQTNEPIRIMFPGQKEPLVARPKDGRAVILTPKH